MGKHIGKRVKLKHGRKVLSLLDADFPDMDTTLATTDDEIKHKRIQRKHEMYLLYK